MQYQAETPEDYITQVPEERQEVLTKLREVIKENLPEGFQEGIQYGMIGYFVPHSLYPDGYHCNPSEPLPFMSFASQKNSVNLYHMGIYAVPEIYDWFVTEYPKYSKRKLDMGKSCIRFKKVEEIPYQLIAELCRKLTPEQWITIYETNIKKK
ncbi:DUF1801 domain-containing protein [Aestuariibaculum sp. YM273]|uniref:DUF1801 domain-containing protein n=1 Tax=Aestuariibaculum sp. YM273 TaxID=3070659 RepID=UPI0027DB78B1|nr:DUF1801 domain-containing protein [Aestuariibaculum sp. YM273]WMI66844.1 DUF1801 domain-containing protein [Aestuariibaculum sp. YM273]